MKEGDLVKCISTNFPLWKTTNVDKSEIDSQANFHPKLNQKLFIDEVLGDFIRFDVYDNEDGFNWWHKSRFVLVDDFEEECFENIWK